VLGVRATFAAAAALAHGAFGQPAWPYASPHWLSTLLSLVLLHVALRRPWAARASAATLLGAIVAVTTLIQQQKGAAFALCAGGLLVADHLLDCRYGPRPPLRELVKRLAFAAAGLLAGSVPFIVVLAVRSGVAPLGDALVRFPLVNYRVAMKSAWGAMSILTASLAGYTWPAGLRCLPVIVLVDGVRVLRAWLHRHDEARARGLMSLLVLGLFSVLSILNFPDFIHLAFIAPVFFVAIAECVDWGVRHTAPIGTAGAVTGALVNVTLFTLLGWQLHDNLLRSRREFSVSLETAFGRVDVRDASAAELVEEIRRLALERGDRLLLCYPMYTSLYLTTGLDNPTPYSILLPGYSGEEQLAAAVDTLERRRVPLVVILEGWLQPGDAFREYVRAHYDLVATVPVPWGPAGIYRHRG
jgi:hypothetical protein